MSTGRRSPPSTTGPTEENIADIGFDYAESGLNIFNNGHTVEVEYDEGSSVGLGGETYEVVQFHFHAGGEHTVDGEQHPMELHIVHRTPDERLAVVGIFLEVGGENVALAPVFDNLPTEVSDEAAPVEGETVDLAARLRNTDLLPVRRIADHTTVHRRGGLAGSGHPGRDLTGAAGRLHRRGGGQLPAHPTARRPRALVRDAAADE